MDNWRLWEIISFLSSASSSSSLSYSIETWENTKLQPIDDFRGRSNRVDLHRSSSRSYASHNGSSNAFACFPGESELGRIRSRSRRRCWSGSSWWWWWWCWWVAQVVAAYSVGSESDCILSTGLKAIHLIEETNSNQLRTANHNLDFRFGCSVLLSSFVGRFSIGKRIRRRRRRTSWRR